VIEEEAH